MNRKLKLLAVLAHPDDESFGLGGTLAKYAAEGVETYLVTATRGECGRFGALGKSGNPVEVGRVREAELRAAAAVLGIREVSILGYHDGAVDKVPSKDAIRDIVSHIRRIQPNIILTFGPEGGYGHPDHIAISQFTTASIVCAADAEYGMEDGSQVDSPAPHRVAKLYYLAWRSDKWEAFQAAFRKLTSLVDGVQRQATPWPDWAITTEIDTGRLWAYRVEGRQLPSDSDVHLRAARSSHRSTAGETLGLARVLSRSQLGQWRTKPGIRPV